MSFGRKLFMSHKFNQKFETPKMWLLVSGIVFSLAALHGVAANGISNVYAKNAQEMGENDEKFCLM